MKRGGPAAAGSATRAGHYRRAHSRAADRHDAGLDVFVTSEVGPTGRLRWRFWAGGRFFSGPAVAGATVYTANVDGRVFALLARTGRPLWTRRLRG